MICVASDDIKAQLELHQPIIHTNYEPAVN